MSEFIKRLWTTLFDRSQKVSARLTALLGLVLPALVLIALLVLLIIFAQRVLPYILVGAFLVYLVFGDYIDSAIMRKQITRNQQVLNDKQVMDAIYRKIANTIVPTVSQVASLPLEPEDIFYDRMDYPNGPGIYFLTPTQLSEQECMKLRRLVINRLSGRVGIPRTQMYQEQIVLVQPDYIFVRNDPQIIQFFAAND